MNSLYPFFLFFIKKIYFLHFREIFSISHKKTIRANLSVLFLKKYVLFLAVDFIVGNPTEFEKLRCDNNTERQGCDLYPHIHR